MPATVAGRGLDTADDAGLVEAYRHGEVMAFEVLYRRYYPVVVRRLARLCGSDAVAEELAQETFLRAAQHMRTLGADLHVRGWLLRIATNLGIDHLRALRRAPLQSFEALLEARPGAGIDVDIDTEKRIVERENLRFLLSVLDGLNPRHRQVLVLREIEGLDYRSIAERMRISCSAVETLLFRARNRFRQEYVKRMAA